MGRCWAFAWVIGVSALSACGAQPDTVDLEAEKAAARAAAGELGETLKGELVAAMQSGGPVAAIEVCAERAPAIASEVSAETGMRVARTAPRVRNASNAPDDWERKQLARFEALIASGTPADELPEMAEIVETENGQAVRWMKAIPMGGVCAACHGESVAEPVLAAIDERYPADEATGFQEGELRGAFTVTKPLGAAR